jgi:hypothetical protein
MNKNHRPLQRWQFLVPLLIFIAVAGLLYIFRELITEIILMPILYVLWVVDLALQIFGQQCIWFLALIIALILSFAFSRRRGKSDLYLRQTVYDPGPAIGRIQFWRRRVRVNSGAIHAVSYRNPGVWELVARALAYHENSDVKEIEEQLRSGQLQVPVEVGQILGLDIQSIEPRPKVGFINSIKLWFRRMVEYFTPQKFVPDPKIEKVAEYLEGLVEVDNDDKNR